MTDNEASVVAHETVSRLRTGFASGRTRPIAWKLQQLSQIERLIDEQQLALQQSLAEDLGKPAVEAWLSELVTVRGEIRALKRAVRSMSRRSFVRTSWVLQPNRASISRQPLGVVLVVSPWNYPVNLVLAPLAAGLAAGNCVIAKPSELAPATSSLLAELIPRYLDPDAVAVLEGGGEVTQALIAERVDHVFFTGGEGVGRLVAEAAAKQLTPVTLELGGKSPAIVDATADLGLASRRIAWGRYLNAGQTCIAPDYVLVDAAVSERFVSELCRAIKQFYGSDPKASKDFAWIVNRQHTERLSRLLSNHGGDVIVGGEVDVDRRYVAPTVIVDVSIDAPIMTEEIFGPILPIVTFDQLDEAISFVSSRPSPLAIYLFSKKSDATNAVANSTQSGALVINSTLEHFAVPQLPFGGVGASGSGSYHGKFGIETLSQRRSILRRPSRMDIRFIYPPYTRIKQSILRRLL